MIRTKVAPLALALLAAGVSLVSADANAKGCNGYVNQWEWGCAPWDNNNGPQYPHYKKPAAAKPAPARVAAPPAPTSTLVNRSAAPIIGTNSAGVIAAGAGNAVSRNGAGTIAAGGGNIASHNGAGTIAAGGGNFHK